MTRKEIDGLRTAIADYMWSEGCSCCRDREAHEQHKSVLGKILRVPKYQDGSGFNFERFRTKAKKVMP